MYILRRERERESVGSCVGVVGAVVGVVGAVVGVVVGVVGVSGPADGPQAAITKESTINALVINQSTLLPMLSSFIFLPVF